MCKFSTDSLLLKTFHYKTSEEPQTATGAIATELGQQTSVRFGFQDSKNGKNILSKRSNLPSLNLRLKTVKKLERVSQYCPGLLHARRHTQTALEKC